MSELEAPIERHVFESDRLLAEHPPVLRDPNKRVVYEIACVSGRAPSARLTYTRWRGMELPKSSSPGQAASLCLQREDIYDYQVVLPEPEAVEWHVNFADPHLFVAYGSGLFAQDEMQVAEHPILGSLREALLKKGMAATTQEHGRPTPVLLQGVERRCRVATDCNDAEGRPSGLYGNAFACASPEAVRRATTAIDPPTMSNLIAMAAPGGGWGPYTPEQVAQILQTAFTGFRAAVLEAGRGPVAVHSGFWGCGAFGGNRVLMAMLQLIAAHMAGMDRLVFHTVDAAGSAALATALDRLRTEFGATEVATPDLVDGIGGMGFEWGVSDGN